MQAGDTIIEEYLGHRRVSYPGPTSPEKEMGWYPLFVHAFSFPGKSWSTGLHPYNHDVKMEYRVTSVQPRRQDGVPCYICTTTTSRSCSIAIWSVQLSRTTTEFDDSALLTTLLWLWVVGQEDM